MMKCETKIMDSMLDHLREHHNSICRHWFEEIKALDIIDDVLRVVVDEQVRLKYLQRCCSDYFTEAAQFATGRPVAVQFISEKQAMDTARNTGDGENQEWAHAGFTQSGFEEDMLLSPDYTFDSFVVGPDNRLAHAAAVAVAKKPGKAYNPFFIYGGVGLGKTHLLQAICQEAMRNHPSMKIYYTSCNGFMNQFLDAVQAGQMSTFRHRFRTYDLLVIDDIHDLSKRGPSQEEFFHTFNILYQGGRQIVLSSDAPPNEIPELEERLISRFNCGLVANIDRPCYETRVAIIRSKAGLKGIELPDDVVSYIAAKIDTNIREIEGTITKIQGLSVINKAKIDLSLAKKAIGERISNVNTTQMTIQGIIETISNYYNLKLADLLSKRRHKSISLPRQIGMYLARKHTRFSLEEIGGYFGGRDHTTVMHAVRTIDSRRGEDAILDKDLMILEKELTGSTIDPIGSYS
ncbi:MAG: chromosomal replication initiator protein DnaA [Phycisphaerales bacterium]|nr:chromosomal replication initiator protein DnaA [Phycisphaerales bacterium]